MHTYCILLLASRLHPSIPGHIPSDQCKDRFTRLFLQQTIMNARKQQNSLLLIFMIATVSLMWLQTHFEEIRRETTTVDTTQRVRSVTNRNKMASPPSARNSVDTSDPSASANTAPLFVLHVGPPKTGTSTIQGVARNHEDILQQDNMYYLGHYAGRPETRLHELSKFCRKCETQEGCIHCPQRWQEFENIVSHHYDLNHNVFVSDETFNRFFSDEQDAEEFLWTRLANILSRWDVRIIFSHRHYHEWVPSNYHQNFNPMGNRAQDVRGSWPDAGGITILSFREYFQNFVSSDNFWYKHPLFIKKQWAKHFKDVRVVSMHGDGDFVNTFFCKFLPEAKSLCEVLKSKPKETAITKNSSSQKYLHYDMLAVAAYQRGFIKKKLKRPDVTAAIKKHAQKLGLLTITDFDLECLSHDQADLFLKMTLELESDVVPDFSEAELRSIFASDAEKGKFCSVDTDLTLQDERWVEFFKTLG